MPRRSKGPRGTNAGFTLIELMIALVLGLIVVAAAGALFVSNRQVYTATESLGRVQESARVAFELMARDVREAGGNPCDRDLPVANVIEDSDTRWWSSWGDGVVGYAGSVAAAGLPFGTAPGQRVAGTDAIELKSAQGGVSVVSHNPTSAMFEVSTVDHGLNDGDIAMICDFQQASIFRVTGAQPGINDTVVHNPGGTWDPGNCTKGLGLPVDCDGPPLGVGYTYGKNSVLVKLNVTRWYVGNNDRGGTSLFRSVLRSGAGPTNEEVVEGVTGMRLEYLVSSREPPTYELAGAVLPTEWQGVSSVRILVDLERDEAVGPNRENITRQLAYVASLRNRNP